MKASILVLSMFAGVTVVILPAQAATQLSPARLDTLDQRGYLTPSFKAGITELVETRQAVDQAKIEERRLKKNLPDLQAQLTAAQAKVASLKQELAKYENTDETDFTVLQETVKSPKTKPEDQLIMVQAYIWAYPASSHQAEAQQDLEQIKKKIADQVQSDKDSEAARIAARADLIKRAAAKQLSLSEWRSFLLDMSQEDVLKYMGRPQYSGADFWVYRGEWTKDPITDQKVGLRISFNGTRVNVVTESIPGVGIGN